MPNFLGWHVNEQTNELGATIQLNSHTFKPLPNGLVDVVATPRTEIFTGDQITKMAEVAGPKSKDFWSNMRDSYIKQLPVFENGRDMTVAAASKGPENNLDFKPVAPAPMA